MNEQSAEKSETVSLLVAASAPVTSVATSPDHTCSVLLGTAQVSVIGHCAARSSGPWIPCKFRDYRSSTEVEVATEDSSVIVTGVGCTSTGTNKKTSLQISATNRIVAMCVGRCNRDEEHHRIFAGPTSLSE